MGISNPLRSLPGLVCVDDKVGFGDRTHTNPRIGDVQDVGSCMEARRLLGPQLHGSLAAVHGHTLTSVGLVG